MSEIDGNISGVPQSGVTGIGDIPKEHIQTYMDIMGISTISQSDKDAIVALFFASMPQLESPEDINLMMQEQQSTIVSDMLDKWSENLKEIDENRKEWQASPDYQMWLETHSPGERQDIEYQEALRGKTVEGMTALTKNEDVSPEVVLGFTVAVGAIGQMVPVVDVASTEMLSVNPIQDAAANFNQVVPPNLRDDLLVAINLFATPQMYQATAETIGGLKTGQTPKDLDFARNFAAGIIAKVKGNEIGTFMNAILVNKMENGQPITDDRISQMATYAKLAMLAVSLAVVYKAQTGWITGDEFAAMLKGDMKLPKDTPEAEAVKLMQGLLKTLPADQRAEIVNALMAYFDRNPSMDAMMKPKKVVDSGLFTKFNLPPSKA